MPRKGYKRPVRSDGSDPDGLVAWGRRFVEHLEVRNYAGATVLATESSLRLFSEWAHDRDITRPSEVTKPVLESYQRWLFYYRKRSGKALTFATQRVQLQKLRGYFKWLSRQNAIPSNPASELELPRIERRLPRAILSEREVERVLMQADLTDALGLRDRAMMEVLYSTGIRRHELAGLELFDVAEDRGTLTVRQGKGKKDRVVPIGERALGWVRRYLDEARGRLVVPPETSLLFLNEHGEALGLGRLTNLMRSYIDGAKLGKTGACHIFRHTMATLMLEGGADVRHIQEILGHAETSTTAIYTRVSIQRLKAVHDATHPAAKAAAKKPGRGAGDETLEPAAEATEEALRAALESEADDEARGERVARCGVEAAPRAHAAR